MTLWEVVDGKIQENYSSLLKSKEHFEIVSKDNFVKAVNKLLSNDLSRNEIGRNIKTNLGTIIVDPDTHKILNGFILLMPTYGGACQKCSKDLVCIYLKDGFKELDPMKCVYVPFLEDIMVSIGREPSIVSSALDNNFGVLLEGIDYDYYCLMCEKWGKISYDSALGLHFES